MSYQEERDRFMRETGAAGIDLGTARKLLRYATTLQRLAVAQCNGDWPAANGTWATVACPECESHFVAASFRRLTWPDGLKRHQSAVCPDCYTAHRVRTLLPEAWIAVFGGDPRGAVLTLYPRGTPAEDIDNGRARDRAIYVPARER